jgi:hypothetical protein
MIDKQIILEKQPGQAKRHRHLSLESDSRVSILYLGTFRCVIDDQAKDLRATLLIDYCTANVNRSTRLLIELDFL